MKKTIHYLKWVIIVFVLLIILTEVTLRITCQKKLARWHAMEYVADSIIGYRYKPNSQFLNSNIAYSNICKTNKFGFPGDDFNIKKEKDCFRIIVIGTSDDIGFTSDGTESYIKRLNKKFKQNGYNVEVLNCSIDGDDRIVRNIQLIKSELVKYEPDLILLRNQFPLRDIIRYRETYHGHIINTTKLSYIDSTKKYIDNVYDSNPNIFKIYNISYIFRYYIKIYLDYKRNQPKHLFVKFSENAFTYEKLSQLRMYVRNDARYNPVDKNEFTIYLNEINSDWNEKTVTWNSIDHNTKAIKTFLSGTKFNAWLDVDVTDYLKEKIKNDKNQVSFLFSIDPSKMRRISFASKEWKSDSIGSFSPMLKIKGKIQNADNKESQTISSEFLLKSTDDGYIRGGDYSEANHETLDSTMQIKNGGNDESYSRKSLIKFNISNIKTIEKASLKLFTIKIEFGEDMAPGIKEYTENESIGMIKSLDSFLIDKKIDLVLFNTYTFKNDTLKSIFFKNDINYLPLNIEYKAEYSFGEKDGHSTQKGHEAIANALYQRLIIDIFTNIKNPKINHVRK